jgi:aminoglycoside phosphotransferase (APT) family kinase protein
VVRVEEALAEALPGVEPRRLRTIESGWDSVAVEVDGEWILRVARRDEVAATYRVEIAVLPELGPLFPVAVPVPIRVGPDWILTRRIPGEPFHTGADIRLLGELLAALHAFDVERARQLGAGTHDPRTDVERFRRHVLPLLEPDEQASAEGFLEEHAAAAYEPRLTHADLGPEHVLVERGRVSGVIDWTDMRVGDPAIDLAWALAASPDIASAYPVDASVARRALLYHALGPWHEVHYGLFLGNTRWVSSGLAGVRERLPKVTGTPDTMAR